MQPLRVRVDLEAKAMKSYSAFPEVLALLEHHYVIVYCHMQDTRCEGECLTLSRDTLGVFCSSSRLGLKIMSFRLEYLDLYKCV